MTRKLVTIQEVLSLDPIPGSDLIERAQVMGWGVVVKKGEFQVGSKCVFFEVDSLLPKRDWSEFLDKRGYRLKTMRLRGTLSQGLALPITIEDGLDLPIGTDVTEQLGVTKYEPPLPDDQDIAGSFPSIPKTDEPRVQSHIGVLQEIAGQEFYATVKLDGTSATYAKIDGEFYVCSRNWRIKKGNNKYWRLAEKYNIESVLPDNTVIQGEICGPGTQKNRLHLTSEDVFSFNLFSKGAGYKNHLDLQIFCQLHGLKSVPLEMVVTGQEAKSFDHSLDAWLERAKGKYDSGVRREGLVVRPIQEQISRATGGRLSFKVLNNDFLLKDEG